MNLKSPQQAFRPIMKNPNSESSSEPPSIYFPAWTSPPKPCMDLETCEIGKPFCWEYDYSWKNTFIGYGNIQSELEDKSIGGIVPSPGVAQFWDAIRKAHYRIYLFDRHFDPSDFCRVLQVLQCRSSITDEEGTMEFLLIANLAEQSGDYKVKFQKLLSTASRAISRTTFFVLSTNGDDQIHDRFALIDNSMWHFGAKIGAMHKSVNAFSGPWHDEEDRMLKFFHNLFFCMKAMIS